MKLKIKELEPACKAFRKLDGYDRVITLDGKEVVIWVPYQLGGKTRYSISKNIRILAGRIEDFQKSKDGVIKEVTGGGNIIRRDETEKIDAFVKKVAALMEEEDEIEGLMQLTLADLKLDQDEDINPIPSEVINGISSFIK